MLVFEIAQSAPEIKEEILSSIPSGDEIFVDSLDGNDIIQILVPLVSIVTPIVSQIIQKYFDDNRVTIKFDGVEISALGYEKAMKILKEVLSERKSSGNDNAD